MTTLFILKRFSYLLIFVLISYLMSVEANGSMPSGNLSGKVIDEQSNAVIDSSIIVIDEIYKKEWSAKTGSNGYYYFKSIPSGNYLVKCIAPDYSIHIISNVGIHPGKTTILNITLTMKGVSEIRVNKKTLLLDNDNIINQMVLTSDYIDKIPLIERDMLLGAISLPDANISNSAEKFKPDSKTVSIKGGSGRNINIIVDGGDNTDSIYGGAMQVYPLIALKEYTIVSQIFSAQYSNSSAAIVNATTKSGDNYSSGSLFFTLRNEMLSKEPFSNKKANIGELGFKRYNFGGTYSNKIKENKMLFYIALEHLIQSKEIFTDTHKVFINEDNINEIEKYSTNFFAKLTNVINDKQRITIRYAYQKDKDYYDVLSNISPTSWGIIDHNAHSILIGHSYFKNSNVTNELIFQYSYYRNRIKSNSNEPLMLFPNLVRYGSNPDAPQESIQTKIEIKDELSFSKLISNHHHNFKGGLDLIITPKLEVTMKGLIDIPQYTFIGNNINSPISTILIMGGNPVAENDNVQFGIFFQDDWLISQKLTLNIGVRYDAIFGNSIDQSESPIYKTLINNEYYNEDYLQSFRSNPNFKNDLNNIQPRISFKYDIKGNDKILISGGYGRYVDFLYFKKSYLYPKLALSDYYIKYFHFDEEGIINPDGSYWKIGDPLPSNQIEQEKLIREIGSTKFKMPYNDQFSIGIEHKLNDNSSYEISYTHSRGKDQYIVFKFNGIDNVKKSRRFPDISSLARMWYPGGFYTYDGLDFIFRKEFTKKYAFIGTYSISRIKGNTLSSSDSYSVGSPITCNDCLIDYTDLKSEYNTGKLNTDSLHNIKAIGLFLLPYRIKMNVIAKLHSGLPYNNFTIIDLNNDGFNYDIPSNYSYLNEQRGDWFKQIDLRISREFLIKRCKYEFLLEIFNLLNNDNPGNYIGNVDSVNYGMPTTWAGDNNYFEQFLIQLGIIINF